MTGTTEIVAWREVYERTQSLWAEGTILKVEGRVRLRNNDRISVHCNHVEKFEIPAEEDVPGSAEDSAGPPLSVIPAEAGIHPPPPLTSLDPGTPPTEQTPTNGVAHPGQAPTSTESSPVNGAAHPETSERGGEDSARPEALEGSTERNGVDVTPVAPPSVFPAEAEPAPEKSWGIHPPPDPAKAEQVWLKVRATGDEAHDAQVLKDAITLARGFPGPSTPLPRNRGTFANNASRTSRSPGAVLSEIGEAAVPKSRGGRSDPGRILGSPSP